MVGVFFQRTLRMLLQTWEGWLARVNLKPTVAQHVLLMTSMHLLWSLWHWRNDIVIADRQTTIAFIFMPPP